MSWFRYQLMEPMSRNKESNLVESPDHHDFDRALKYGASCIDCMFLLCHISVYTAQKMKFSIKNLFSKFEIQ